MCLVCLVSLPFLAMNIADLLSKTIIGASSVSLVYRRDRQASIKTENHLMVFSDSSWQDCPDTGRSTGEYIIFYQGGTIDHDTHVPGPVAQSSAES